MTGEITPADLGRWIAWQIARRRLPPLNIRAKDQTDATILLEVAGSQFWWPIEFPLDDLELVWAEVFLPYPPNGHAYEHGQCRIGPANWVIDAGACEGFFVSYALRSGARVLAVEPVPRLAYCLRKTFDAEVKKGNVLVVNALLGARIADARINVASSPIAARRSTSQGEPVSGTTIDALLASSVVPTVDFIKMDIEGSEVSALSGALKTLVQHRPVLSLAIYHNADEERQVAQLLRSSGARYATQPKGLVRNKAKLVHQILHAWPVR